MPQVTTMTFVLSSSAALAVAHQLAMTTEALHSGELCSATAQDITRHLDAPLRSGAPFDFTLHPTPHDAVRAVWHPIAVSSGIRYLAQNHVLATINLLLSGQDAIPDKSAIDRAAEILSPIGPYIACLDHVASAPRPLVAIFTSSTGQLSTAIELTTILFAGVFFHHHPCAVRAAPRPVTHA